LQKQAFAEAVSCIPRLKPANSIAQAVRIQQEIEDVQHEDSIFSVMGSKYIARDDDFLPTFSSVF
jgi:hypothetical protein